jgi:hypothetical protein
MSRFVNTSLKNRNRKPGLSRAFMEKKEHQDKERNHTVLLTNIITQTYKIVNIEKPPRRNGVVFQTKK